MFEEPINPPMEPIPRRDEIKIKPGSKKTPAKNSKVEEMSEEDLKLRNDLEALVKRLSESDDSLYLSALETMRELVRASTTSMTSVPKPLKFLLPHYATMKKIHRKLENGSSIKKLCADIISVLAMTTDEQSDCLNYRLIGMREPVGEWGHEYVRHLTMEMAEEWRKCAEGPGAVERRTELLSLVREIVDDNIRHNAEIETCDLLIEIERLDLLIDSVEEPGHERICLYLLSCSPLTPDPDNQILIRTAKDIYLKFSKRFEALRCAVMLNDLGMIRDIFLSTEDVLTQKQMAVLLGRQQIFLEIVGISHLDKLTEINGNAKLSSYFRSLARELDILEPKTPESVYKNHLEQGGFFPSSFLDCRRLNLASAFVNGFVNTGFGSDKMMSTAEDASSWFYKNSDYGVFSAAATLGLVWRWDIDGGLEQCCRFLYVSDDFIKAGMLLAIGIVSSGVQDPCDPASALLLEHINSKSMVMRIGSILGLGLAYANSKREAVLKNESGGVVFELKKLLATDKKSSAFNEVKGLTGLALGFILVGTADYEIAMEIVNLLMERSTKELQGSHMRFLAVGVALIFLGTQDKSEVFVESVRALPEPFGSMMSTLIEACAYAGSGNVLKIQKLLHLCSEHYETKENVKSVSKEGAEEDIPSKKPKVDTSSTATGKIKKEDEKPDSPKSEKKNQKEKLDLSWAQAVAVLGIGLIAMGEEIGCQMSLRTFSHLVRYGEPVIRRAVPLALALISTSNPQLPVIETLSKFSHDADADTAHNAIFAMGVVGAGTNNARLISMLRQLASFHSKDRVSLMLVRMAQGMTSMGKGTMTLSPFHSDRQLMSLVSVAAVFTTCFAFLDGENSILNKRQHYLFYALTPAIQPRHLITLVEDESDPENLQEINVSVRVGQAVDVVTHPGKPKAITGFQTHTTPVLLAYGERAELANDKYISLTPYMEGVVILKKNPDYKLPAISPKRK